jgi:hypothetical protein
VVSTFATSVQRAVVTYATRCQTKGQRDEPTAEKGANMSPWFMVLPVGGLGWWMLGFPPGWGWLVAPMIPTMPVSFGMLLVLATVVIGAYAGLIWVRNNV